MVILKFFIVLLLGLGVGLYVFLTNDSSSVFMFLGGFAVFLIIDSLNKLNAQSARTVELLEAIIKRMDIFEKNEKG